MTKILRALAAIIRIAFLFATALVGLGIIAGIVIIIRHKCQAH